MFKADRSLTLTVGRDVVAEFDSPEEEAEFLQKIIDGPEKERSRNGFDSFMKGWRNG